MPTIPWLNFYDRLVARHRPRFRPNENLGWQTQLRPVPADAWTGYAFHINYRGRLIKVAVGKENVVFTLLKGEPLDLQVYGKDITLNGSHTVALEK